MSFFERYKPNHSENRLMHEGDVEHSREHFYANRGNNLEFLLKQRYDWMNKYIQRDDVVIDVGCGSGLSQEFINTNHLFLSDVENHDWVDIVTDAQDMKCIDDGIANVVITSNSIHHFSNPLKFFQEAHRILSPNGYLLIQEFNCSILGMLILKIMRHEGWDWNVNPFYNRENRSNPWDANTAIPNLIFDRHWKHELEMQGWKIEHQSFSECLLLPLSGGVVAKAPTIQLPRIVLKLFRFVDIVLVTLLPQVFALQRQTVLRKVNERD